MPFMSGFNSDSLVRRVNEYVNGLSPLAALAWAVVVVLLALGFVVRPGLFVTNLLGGLVYGMILVLVSLGLALILGLMGVINFAHGALFMLGAYFSYQIVAGFGLPFWAALVVAPIAVGLVGVIMEMTVLRPLYDQEPIVSLLATFGLTLMIAEVVRAVWGAAPLGYPIPSILETSISLVVTQVGTFRLFSVAVAALVVTGVYLLISRTDFGLTVRAGVQDGEMTRFLGANLSVSFTAMFFVGSALAGLGGVLRSGYFGLDLGMGRAVVILAFVIVVVGGAGSLFGSVVSGLLIGEARFLTPVVLSALARVTGLEWLRFEGIGGLVPYLVMIVVLLVRPRGLFGEVGFLE